VLTSPSFYISYLLGTFSSLSSTQVENGYAHDEQALQYQLKLTSEDTVDMASFSRLRGALVTSNSVIG
jgi:hypothetical protein